MIHARREWMRRAAGALALVAGGQWSPAAETKRLRTIAYNACGLKGWPSFAVRTRLARADDGLVRLLADSLARYQPDVVTLSEAPPKQTVAQLAGRLGMNWAWFSTRRTYPGALLTRGEIVESADLGAGQKPELFTRHWGRAMLRLDGNELIVHSLHLHPSDARLQWREVEAACRVIEIDLHRGANVLVQGDSNHAPRDAQYDRLRRAGLVDSYEAAGKQGGNTFPSIAPASRIDYVWAGGPLAARVTQARALDRIPFAWSVERGFALSDHLPWLAEFRGS